MNTTAIIAAIVALLGGLVAGTTIEKGNTEELLQKNETAEMRNLDADTTVASDFVSLRPGIGDLPTESLSTAETEGLLLMREEEKLARDVYQTLYEKWGINIFSNIAQSEQTHTEAVRDLLEKYNLADPVTEDVIGVFTNSDMQELYDTLVAKGLQSETDAFIVGATIEDLDIFDLQNLMAETDNEDILLVYENLTRGSRNHLRSFINQLDRNGATYEAQYITDAEYQDILDNDQEQGGGNKQSGSKGGRGWGKNR